jgi:type II secretory pathway component PulF
MPFFRYAATDAQGKAVHGTVQAKTPEEAANALYQKGIRVTAWLDPNARHAIPAAQQTPVPAPAQRSDPRVRQIELASAPVLNRLPASSGLAPKRTRPGTDKERFFLFTQVANLLRAGVNPHQGFGDMAARMRRDDYREAMQLVAQKAAEGLPISEVLAAYPDLFPSHAVGLVRAGEIGGFLPEACTAVAQQAEAAHQFRRSLWMVWVVAIHAFLVIPLGVLAYKAFPRAFELTESSNAAGFGAGLSAVGAAFRELLIWPVGPLALLIYALAYVIYKWVHSRPMTGKRHRWSLRTPILGGRARHEGISLFAWVLGKVAQGGGTPHQSWEVGLECVPNLALRRELREAGQKLHTGERLSAAFSGTRLFPEEYAPMMATAELTGDVPGTLQTLSDLSRRDFETSTTKSKAAAWVMSSTALVVTGGIILILMVVMWYYRLPETILKGMDVP